MGSCVFAFPSRESFQTDLSKSFYNEYQSFRQLFDEASEFVKEDLCRFAYTDKNAKPWLQMACLLTHCCGVERVLRQEGMHADAYFGFSQGEFTAITAAGCVGFPQVLALLIRLDRIILDDSQFSDGAMARVVGLERGKLLQCCERADPTGEKLGIAVCFSGDQNVISGQKEAVALAGSYAKELGARWIISLGGALAFHSPFCKKLGEKSLSAFDMLEYKKVDRPVYLCTSGKAETDGALIKRGISTQISNPVVFDRAVHHMEEDGVEQLIELGAGCSISGNTRVISSKIKCAWVTNPEDLKKLLQSGMRSGSTANASV